MPTFSELYGQLPRGKRTPRNAVLLALHCLGALANATAVDSGAVGAELKLRLRGDAPGNVPDILRKAGARVECVAVGPTALRWYLTPTGTAELAGLGVELANQPSSANPSAFDVAVVCALHTPEFAALLNAFGGESAWKSEPDLGQTHRYKSITTRTAAGANVTLVAGAPTHMGLTATAVIATQMLMMFRPKLIAMVGIAAGTKASGRGYGDILVANPSVDYSSGKVAFIKGEEVFQPDPFPLPVDSRLHALLQEERRTRRGLDEIAEGWKSSKPGTPLNVHIGPLGAADQVIDSEQRLADITRNWRKLIGVDMETYALYRAAHEAPRPKPTYVAFKSVCDFAANKSDSWQDYAAFTAAQYFRHFLTSNWGAVIA